MQPRGGDPVGLLGRATELAALEGVLLAESTRDAVIIAPPGMGKTALLETFAAKARVRGAVILTARPTGPEQHLAWSGLATLLAEIPPVHWQQLPEPQHCALTSIVQSATGPTAVAPQAVYAGLRTLLRNLAEGARTVVCLDDAQWFDVESAQAISAVLPPERGHALPRLVLASRPEDSPLIRKWGHLATGLTPLTESDVHEVVRTQCGVSLTRMAVRELQTVSGGNPLVVLEAARRMVGDAPPTSPISELIRDRIMRLPAPTRAVLLLAALAVEPTLTVLAEACGTTIAALIGTLDPARTDGLVDLTDRVVFRHPLYADTAAAIAAVPEAVHAHRLLAQAEPSLEARVRHRGQATAGTDPALALMLEDASREAWERGAHASSLELLDLAIDRTAPTDGALGRRRGQRGARLLLASRHDEARADLTAALVSADPRVRAAAAADLAMIAAITVNTEEAETFIAQADTDLAPLDLRVRALLTDPHQMGGPRVLERARKAEALLAQVPPDAPGITAMHAATLTTQARCLAGMAEPYDRELTGALAEEAEIRDWGVLRSPRFLLGLRHLQHDRYDQARTTFLALAEQAEGAGDDLALSVVWGHVAWLDARHAVWSTAVEAATRADQIGAAHGNPGGALMLMVHAWADACRADPSTGLDLEGRDPVARLEALEPGFALMGPYGAHWRSVTGSVLLARGEPKRALEHLEAGLALARALGVLAPGIHHLETDWAEARIALGLLDGVAETLDELAARAERTGNDTVLASIGRVRLSLRVATGDIEGAAAAVSAMLAAFDDPAREPLETARAWLTGGQILRRGGARRAAQDTLRRAVDLFTAAEHRGYVAQAEADLARVGVRVTSTTELTGTERQVAELAAAGFRNREIAQRLFLAEKTVEASLSRTYRKLAIRSRAQLRAALGSKAQAPDEPPATS